MTLASIETKNLHNSVLKEIKTIIDKKHTVKEKIASIYNKSQNKKTIFNDTISLKENCESIFEFIVNILLIYGIYSNKNIFQIF